MAAFIIYIIRWAVCLTMLYSLFGLFLKRETLHSINRIVLLFVLIAGMILPLIQIDTTEANIVTQGREMLESQITSVSHSAQRLSVASPVEHPSCPSPLGGAGGGSPQEGAGGGFIIGAIAVYLIGLIICWLRYFWQMAALVMLIRRSNRIRIDGVPEHVHVVTNPDVKAPCSWMQWIILNTSDTQIRAIIKHELAHVRHGHSWDILLCELTCRMLWFVPFAWMLRQDLRDIHEYQADRSVLRDGIRDEEYQLLLIKKATSTGLQPVVNAFNQSPIKRRFKMMYRKPSPRWVALKAAYLLPLSALAIVAFARPKALSEIEEKVEQEVTKAVATVAQNNVNLTLEDQEEPTKQPAMAEAKDTIQAMPDANLVKADLADQSEEELRAKGMAVYREVNELTDSVMQAVGARKIAEGTYVGHFQPSLNSDTVRIRQVTVLNTKSQVTMGSGVNTINSNDPSAYDLTLQQGTRKGETGYYIRYMQPANSTVRNYDNKEVDPKMLSTDNVLVKGLNFRTFRPVAIERLKKETRLYFFIPIKTKGGDAFVEKLFEESFSNYAIHDMTTGDKYLFRSMDKSYFKLATIDKTDNMSVYQTCIVFPPLDKKVNEVKLAPKDTNLGEGASSFNLNDIPRKGRVITK